MAEDETIYMAPAPQRAERVPLCSVGRLGINRPDDVALVRELLAQHTQSAGQTNSAAMDRELSKCDPGLIAAIERYQANTLGLNPPSGRIDPEGATIRSLTGQPVPPA